MIDTGFRFRSELVRLLDYYTIGEPKEAGYSYIMAQRVCEFLREARPEQEAKIFLQPGRCAPVFGGTVSEKERVEK